MRCKCKTLEGYQCKRKHDPEIPYCWQHSQDIGWTYHCNSLRGRVDPQHPPQTSVVAASLPQSGGRKKYKKKTPRKRSKKSKKSRKH